jgi:FkbM family methyltransferase
MEQLKTLAYKLLAPLLRSCLKNRVTSKNIKGGNGLVLHYPMGQHLVFLGQREIAYEYELQELLLREIEKGHFVLEIGSNIGQYSLLIAQKTGIEGKVVCIEPDSGNFNFLSRNVQVNNLHHVILLHMAVGDNPGKVVLYEDSITGGRMSSLSKKHTGDHFRGKSEIVEVTTLASLIETYGLPDLIKVDAEGAEALIFSSISVLPKSTTYFVEVRTETARNIFQRFTEQGFSIFSLSRRMKRILNEDDLVKFDNWLIKYE